MNNLIGIIVIVVIIFWGSWFAFLALKRFSDQIERLNSKENREDEMQSMDLEMRKKKYEQSTGEKWNS